MAESHESKHGTADDRRAGVQTKTLGVLVAVMVVAGVVALLLTVFGGNSKDNQAAGQPAGSQVGKQTSSSAAASSTIAAPTTSVAATTTTSAPIAAAPTTSAVTKASTPKAKPAKTKASASPTTKVVKYKVKKGDNLTQIAGWFNQRGYGLVYDWNKSVIGQNPNLIYPGQTIIVSLTGDKMKVTTKNK
ncbi:LysM peptidoglycan-binding domain-containing protein [uncultured Jatrophihabitans sp.]|uniref:LysM peptidoglycan-binding domain-containing protein n=1 Tax=uncultured Jatrophihabitans sp. TaxID=1610747 RepID=UPI0035CA76B3